MKCLAAIVSLLVSLCAVSAGAGEAPREVAGFALGQDIAKISDRLLMTTVLPLRYQEYLEEVEIAPMSGFKSGLITYGTCLKPGRIVRIKLKYDDSSRAFYDALLARVKERFGKPSAYEGDPFHVVIDWKWSFVDPEGKSITLHLSHNNRDTEEKFGNSVKLTWATAIDEEGRCFIERQPEEQQQSEEPRKTLKTMTADDWERFTPH